MKTFVEFRKYESIESLSSVNRDYTIPSGKQLILREIGGNGFGAGTSVSIVWDPDGDHEIILVTEGDCMQSSSKAMTGDGSRVVRITLSNQTLATKDLGAYFIGWELDG